jgi:hypothetical protein
LAHFTERHATRMSDGALQTVVTTSIDSFEFRVPRKTS